MIISTEARTLPSITLSNYRPLTRFGFSYEVFLAEMEHSDQIVFEDGFTAGKPRLAGLRFSIEPAAGWSLSANRLMQFGGGERGGSSFGDFLRCARPSRTRATSSDDVGTEFGNQIAAWTSRFIFPGRTPFAGVSRVRRRGHLLRGQLSPGQRGAVRRHHVPAAVAALRSHVRSERVAERLVCARHLPGRHDQRRSRARSLGRRPPRLRRCRRRADAHAATRLGAAVRRLSAGASAHGCQRELWRERLRARLRRGAELFARPARLHCRRRSAGRARRVRRELQPRRRLRAFRRSMERAARAVAGPRTSRGRAARSCS